MKINKKKATFLSIIIILLAAFIYSYYSYSKLKLSNQYEDVFSGNLLAVVGYNEAFDMADITPFEWDKMIVFSPYTSRDEMEKTVGREWTTYSYIGYYLFQKTSLGDYPLSDDSVNKIIFMHGDEIILDVTFNRNQVDVTQISQIIHREEAAFSIEEMVLKQNPSRE
ncbi:hypothetical protein [Paenibacillus sp. 1P07SE]|uniref:hypothetical protein n=1 Tax=Paenibacillus sp. 1P07SE TaxID=3132209 RepID=UPI0039A46D5D